MIHCAAERRPDVMAKNVEAARELNIGATRIVCEEAGMLDALTAALCYICSCACIVKLYTEYNYNYTQTYTVIYYRII